MRESLNENSAAILALALDLEQLVSAPQPDAARLAFARFKLAKLGSARIKLLETRIYPALFEHLDEAEAAIVRRLRDERIRGQARTSQHISTWGPDRLVTDWREYQRVFAGVIVRLRARIAVEQAAFIPAIEKVQKLRPASVGGQRETQPFAGTG